MCVLDMYMYMCMYFEVAFWHSLISCFLDCLIENMKNGPYSLSVDGSNDTGVEKLTPLTVRIFNVNR